MTSCPPPRPSVAIGPRSNDIEIDIVGADREPIARQLLFVGSIKWLERSAFDEHDFSALLRHRTLFTGELLPLVAVSRAGVSCGGLDATYGPDELIESWAGRRIQAPPR
jgi:hypothetical protein